MPNETPPPDDLPGQDAPAQSPASGRRAHPLERTPPPAPGPDAPPGARRINLRIPTVPPTVTYVLIAVNIAVFALRLISPQLDNDLVEWGANNTIRVLQQGEFYRLFTSMFLHASIYGPFNTLAPSNLLHLLFNMIALYSIGRELERFFGHLRFGLVYLLGGLAGSVLSVLLSDASTWSIGASGAVFAVLAAEMVFLYKHRRLFGAVGRARLQNTLVLLVMNLMFGFVANLGDVVRIDNLAHLGGALGGAALTWFISPFFLVRRHPEFENELLAEDINPLRGRYGAVSAFLCVLALALIAGRLLVLR